MNNANIYKKPNLCDFFTTIYGHGFRIVEKRSETFPTPLCTKTFI